MKATAQKVQEVRESFLENQEEPTVNELAEGLGINPEEIILACNANLEPLSFELAFNDSSDPFSYDLLMIGRRLVLMERSAKEVDTVCGAVCYY